MDSIFYVRHILWQLCLSCFFLLNFSYVYYKYFLSFHMVYRFYGTP